MLSRETRYLLGVSLQVVRDLKAPADFASVLTCKLGQKLVLAMEGRINKQMPASFNVVSYSLENIEMVYCHQSPPGSQQQGNHRYSQRSSADLIANAGAFVNL
jgi:hypothetical protein